MGWGKKIRAVIALLVMVSAAAANASAAAPNQALTRMQAGRAAASADGLRQRIETVLASPGAWRAHWGIKVVSLDNHRTLYSYNEQKLFTPASNTKLFTAALALDLLGANFRFRTSVEADAAPDRSGRVAGDLRLVGRGDPNLSSRVFPYKEKTQREGAPLRDLDSLADQIVAGGVRYIDGDVVADDTYFVFERYGDGWSHDDLMWWYGAPVSALTVNDNMLFVDVLPGEKPGDRALIHLEPYQDYYHISNRVLTVEARARRPARGSSGLEETPPARRVCLMREPGSQTLELWGRIPAGDSGAHEQVAIDDPALFAARYLRDALVARGVLVHGQPRARHLYPYEFEDLRSGTPAGSSESGSATGGATPSAVAGPAGAGRSAPAVLAQLQSRPLLDDLKVILKDSQNLHAEILLRTVARERRQIGSVAAGLEEMKAFLSRAMVAEEEYAFYDGSGLSRQNLASPAALVALLEYMDQQESRDVWRDMLPVAGTDGTLRERFKETPAAGKILAKTGTLMHVNSLSGYATTSRGERLAFAIMVNHHNLPSRQAVQLIDRICQALISTP